MRQGSSDKDKALMRAIINLLEGLQGPSLGPSSVSCAFHRAVARIETELPCAGSAI